MSRLPSGYIEVEYIEGNGTQYIDTRFYTAITPVKYHIVYGHDAFLSGAAFFGAREGESSQDSGWAYIASNGNIALYVGETSALIGAQSVGRVNDLAIEITSDTEYSYSYNGVAGSGTYRGSRSESISQYLFAINRWGAVRWPSAIKVYAFSITENGNLVRNFVPCIKNDGEAGMYDTVTATFFGNSGSGAFIAGDIVMSQWMITDRTSHDVDRVKILAEKAWQDMSAEERAEWLSPMKGSYNYTDLNRVEEAVAYVTNRLNEFGYLPYPPVTRSWSAGEIPTNSDLARYFGNVAMLRRAIAVWESTPVAPTSVDRFGANEANALEQILIDVDLVLTRISQAWFYSGDLYAAEV